VYLDTSDISTTCPSCKLTHCCLGPFVVEAAVGSHAYCLHLPASMCSLHPVFPVVKLMPCLPDPIPGHCTQPPPPPVIIDSQLEYKVEKILDSWVHCNRLQYLVKWKGYSYKENSWENAQDIHAPALVAHFHHENPGAVRMIGGLVIEEGQYRRMGEEEGCCLHVRTPCPRGGVMYNGLQNCSNVLHFHEVCLIEN